MLLHNFYTAVFGWDVVNTSLSEQGQNYQLKVNIAKGVEQLATNTRIRFNVVDTGAGTAGEELN